MLLIWCFPIYHVLTLLPEQLESSWETTGLYLCIEVFFWLFPLTVPNVEFLSQCHSCTGSCVWYKIRARNLVSFFVCACVCPVFLVSLAEEDILMNIFWHLCGKLCVWRCMNLLLYHPFCPINLCLFLFLTMFDFFINILYYTLISGMVKHLIVFCSVFPQFYEVFCDYIWLLRSFFYFYKEWCWNFDESLIKSVYSL